MGQKVQRVKTTVSEPQMAQALIVAWKSLFGNIPSKEQVALLIAQNNLETGHRASMWNFNVGNITTDGNDQYNYYDDLTTDEQVQPGVWKKKNLKYRSYNSLEDGAKDYLKLISGKHYSNAWQHIVNPDPRAFSKALKDAGYYTANEAAYEKGIVNLNNEFEKSNSYEQAMNGKVNAPSNFGGIHQQPANDVDVILNNYLQSVMATEKLNKKLYKQYLPTTDITIKIIANDYTNAVEFGRILSAAFEEELLAKSFVSADENNVEVSASIHGNKNICIAAANQLTNGIIEAFEFATQKLGGIKIKTQIINKISQYNVINLKVADYQHRKFLLNLMGNNNGK